MKGINILRRSKNIKNFPSSDFYCTICGNKGIPIIRQPSKAREPGHLKKLYCLYCNKETNMAEIKPNGKYTLDDFWIEFNYHNFDENGNRKESYKKFVQEVMKHEK